MVYGIVLSTLLQLSFQISKRMMFISQTSGILVSDTIPSCRSAWKDLWMVLQNLVSSSGFIMFYPIRCHLLKQNQHPFLVKFLTQPPLKHPATPGRSKHNSFHWDLSTKAQGDRNEVGTDD